VEKGHYCEYCWDGCGSRWFEVLEREEVDVPGEGGGIFTLRRLPFCSLDCLWSWADDLKPCKREKAKRASKTQ